MIVSYNTRMYSSNKTGPSTWARLPRPYKTGTADLPLHRGKAPAWLFQRMAKLGGEITAAVVTEFGPEDMLRRLSDSYWFQALGCVLGFDWHSSGLTTTVCGALKMGIKGRENELGFYVAGGKGRASRKTPAELEVIGDRLSLDPEPLVYASRMSAKVDSSGVQDGYQLYHHSLFVTSKGDWAVVQQGMNENNHYARRYHWLGYESMDFVCEPHTAICCDHRGNVLNLVASESGQAREAIADIACHLHPDRLIHHLKSLGDLQLPARHHVEVSDIHPERMAKIFLKTYERSPQSFQELIGLEGVGPKTIRALALVAEVVYGVQSSFRDPARFSYAHGGKDGHPYPVDRSTYDRATATLERAVKKARLGDRQELAALRRLHMVAENGLLSHTDDEEPLNMDLREPKDR